MSSSRDHGGHRAHYPLSFDKACQLKGNGSFFKIILSFSTKKFYFLLLSERYRKHIEMGINTETQIDSQSFGQTTSITLLPGLKNNSSKTVGTSLAVHNAIDVYAQYTQKLLRNRGDFNFSDYH